MRIAHIALISAGVGGEAHVRGILGAFRELGHEVVEVNNLDRLSVRHSKFRSVAHVLPRIGKELVLLNRSWWFCRAAEKRLRAPLDFLYVRDQPFDLSPVHLVHRLGAPLVLEVNSPPWEIKRLDKATRFGAWVVDRMFRSKVRQAGLIVVVSQVLGEVVQQEYGVPPEKIAVVPNGVNLDDYKDDRRTEFRQRYQLGDSFVIGFVGTFYRWHGAERLVPMLKSLLESGIDARLLLVGSGEREPNLRKLAARLGVKEHVVLTGHVQRKEVPGLLAAMDVATAPHERFEPFYFSPLKVFEYLAAGRPVVASSVGQIRDLLSDEKAGFLVEPEHDALFVDRLAQLARNPTLRKEQGKAARSLAREYSWLRAARQILGILKERRILSNEN